MFRKFFQNTRKPKGLGGKIMLKMMNAGHVPMAKWGLSHIHPSETDHVLDIGCGGGKNIAYFLSLCTEGNVTGLDHSALSVQKSREFNKDALAQGRCRIVEGNVSQLPFEANSFHMVSAFETVYFWPDIVNAFKEVHRVLKSDGTFLIVNEASDNRAEKWTKIINGMKIYTKDELRVFLEEAGFSDIEADSDSARGWITLVSKKQG